MLNRIMSRVFISPVATATFVVVSLTGFMLDFHLRYGNVRRVHGWIGYTFITVGIVHLVLNWKPFVSYFRQRLAPIAVALSLASTVVLWLSAVQPRPNQVLQLFDLNHDGVIDASEMAAAASTLKALDLKHDGRITAEEIQAALEKRAK